MVSIQKPKVVLLTGAGISAESGIQTFRGSDGLWNGHSISDVATPEGFERNPSLVHAFYNERRSHLQTVEPNLAHMSISNFQKTFPDTYVVTQNVDDLHERAGNKHVIHMHGELKKVRCQETREVFTWEKGLSSETPHPKKPELKGSLRPHIVWFGEMPLFMEEIENLLSDADYFIAVGTSGQVYPAAGFVQMVPPECKKIEVNLEETEISAYFDESFFGKASKGLPELFDVLKNKFK